MMCKATILGSLLLLCGCATNYNRSSDSITKEEFHIRTRIIIEQLTPGIEAADMTSIRKQLITTEDELRKLNITFEVIETTYINFIDDWQSICYADGDNHKDACCIYFLFPRKDIHMEGLSTIHGHKHNGVFIFEPALLVDNFILAHEVGGHNLLNLNHVFENDFIQDDNDIFKQRNNVMNYSFAAYQFFTDGQLELGLKNMKKYHSNWFMKECNNDSNK